MPQNTKAELAVWVSQDWRRAFSYAIENNSRAVYDFIQAALNKPLPNWMMGFEAASANKAQMQGILEAAAVKSGNPENYAIQFLAKIPYNPNAQNWTQH